MATKININGIHELDFTLPGTTTASIAAGIISLINAGFNGVRKVTSSPDTILSSDNQKLVDYNSGSAIAVTLPQAGTAGFDNHFVFWAANIGVGTVTITPTTSTIDGQSNMKLDQGTGAIIFSDGVNYFSVQGGGGGGSSITMKIHQVAHGFTTGQAVYFTGSAWALAEANAGGTLGIGIAVVVDADNFKLILAGDITGLTGLTAGQYYFVSDATPGALTSTEPTTVNNYSNPLLFAISTTEGIVLPFRPSRISAGQTVVTKTANYTAVAEQTVKCDTSLGGFTITLPAAASNSAARITVKKISTDFNALVVATTGGDKIDLDSTKTITVPQTSITMQSDASITWEMQ